MINSVVISPNDLAQLMSGQTVTGLLNPDGTITLNSNVLSGHQIATNGISRQQILIKNELPTTLSSPSATSNNLTSSPSISYYATTNRQSHGAQQQDNPPNILGHSICDSVSISTNTASGQKRLTPKQKQQQQQQLHVQQDSQQVIQQTQFYDQQQQQQQPINNTQINLQQRTHDEFQQQQQHPQIVATIQLPNGQIGQLIAPSGGQYWSPNAINIQQLSMAVAATMPQSMPIGQTTVDTSDANVTSTSESIVALTSTSNGFAPDAHHQISNQTTQSLSQVSMTRCNLPVVDSSQPIDGNTQPMVQLSNGSMAQIMTRSGNCEPSGAQQIWSGGPISLSELSALAQQGVVQVIPMGLGCIPNSTTNNSPNNNTNPRQVGITQSGIQNSISQDNNHLNINNPNEGATMITGQQDNNDCNEQVLNQTQSSQQQPPIKKLKRLACTCPNCQDGEYNRNSGDQKKKQHICHFPDCNKVYGKTSHLRAHLRWHSGERPYVCNCGKKFTRSDELQRHRRTHTGEKRFECSECFKRFMRSDHLSKHFKTHVISSGSAKLT